MKYPSLKCLTCSACGWVHFAVDKAHIDKWKADWEAFWPTLDTRGKSSYGVLNGPPSVDHYNYCFRCGKFHTVMKPSTEKELADLGDGHTLQPIKDPSE